MLLAFFGVAYLAVLSGCLNIVLQFVGLAVKKNDHSQFSLPRVILRMGKVCEIVSQKSNNFVIACSDQQLITGIAYAIFLSQSKHVCELSIYHFKIILHTMIICCITFWLSLTNIAGFWESRTKGFMRICSGVVLFILTGVATKVSWSNAYLSSANNDLQILPAMCLDQLVTGTVVNRQGTNIGPVLFYCIAFLCFVYLILNLGCLMISSKLDSLDSLLILRRALSFGEVVIWVVLNAIYILTTFGPALAFLIYYTMSITRLRGWLRQSAWLDPKDDHSEHDLLMLGQALPATLFVLPLLGFCSIYKSLISST